jgi:3-oxoacyl-[acyl-carrier-protein] synthase III
MRRSKIAGHGFYVPEKVVSNQDLEKIMDTSDAWIQERTGIKERRYYDPESDTVSNMGARAATIALERSGINARDIDFIILATLSPDYFFPGSGVLIQKELGLESIGALDVRNQCSGFIYALSIADNFIKTGMYDNILVIGSEIHSSGLDLSTRGRDVSVIFGDGAGAVVVSPETREGKGILSTHLHSQGEFADELAVKNPGSSGHERLTVEMIQNAEIYPQMNGSNVFKHAVTRMPEAIMEALEANGKDKEDIDLIIPHQANARITEFVAKKFGFGPEKIVSNIHKYGNTTAASIPIALAEAWEEGRIKEGSLVCLTAFGSGFTWASALIQY